MTNNLWREQKKLILNQSWTIKNTEQLRKAWTDASDTIPPTWLNIYRINDEFATTGSMVNAPKFGRPWTSMNEENEISVALTSVNSSKNSTQRASEDLSVPKKFFLRLMRKFTLKLKPYRPWMLHGILEDDSDSRLQFCKMMRKKKSLINNQTFLIR